MKLKCLTRKGGQLFPDDTVKSMKTQSQLETIFKNSTDESPITSLE